MEFPLSMELVSHRGSKGETFGSDQGRNSNKNLIQQADHSGPSSSCSSSSEYILSSVVVHQGSPNFGHYFCFCRPSPVSRQDFWIKCDDGRVSQVTFQDVQTYSFGSDEVSPPTATAFSPGLFNRKASRTSSAYILQYNRIDPSESSDRTD